MTKLECLCQSGHSEQLMIFVWFAMRPMLAPGRLGIASYTAPYPFGDLGIWEQCVIRIMVLFHGTLTQQFKSCLFSKEVFLMSAYLQTCVKI